MSFRKMWAFFKRDLQEYLSYKTPIALDAISILAQVFLFFFLARLVNTGSIPQLADSPGGYFPFALTGIALASWQAAAMESFAKAIGREQGAGTLEAISLSPTSLRTVVMSSLFWTSFAVLARLAVFLGIGFLFFGAPLQSMNLGSALLTLALSLAALSGLGLISAGLILTLKRSDPLGYALNGLSRLFSGVYFPAAMLPGFLKTVSVFLPLTCTLEAMRKSVLEGAGPEVLMKEWAMLAAFAAVLLPAGFWFFSFSLKKARKACSLAFS